MASNPFLIRSASQQEEDALPSVSFKGNRLQISSEQSIEHLFPAASLQQKEEQKQRGKHYQSLSWHRHVRGSVDDHFHVVEGLSDAVVVEGSRKTSMMRGSSEGCGEMEDKRKRKSSGRYGIESEEEEEEEEGSDVVSNSCSSGDEDEDDEDEFLPDPLPTLLKVSSEGTVRVSELSPITSRQMRKPQPVSHRGKPRQAQFLQQQQQQHVQHDITEMKEQDGYTFQHDTQPVVYPRMREQDIAERYIVDFEERRREVARLLVEEKRSLVSSKMRMYMKKAREQYTNALFDDENAKLQRKREHLERREENDQEVNEMIQQERINTNARIKKLEDIRRKQEKEKQREKIRLEQLEKKRLEEELRRKKQQEEEEERRRKRQQEEEEEKRKREQTLAEEEAKKKKQQLEEEEEKKKKNEREKQETEANTDVIQVPAKGTSPPAYVEAQKIIQRVKAARESYMKHKDANKQYMNKVRKMVNKNFNAVSTAQSSVMEKVTILRNVLTEAQQLEPLYIYAKDVLAQKLVFKGATANERNRVSSFAFGMIAVQLCNAFPDLTDYIRSNFYETCPYTIPMYAQRRPGQSEEEYRQAMGYEDSEERHDTFVQRMVGMVSLYAGIVQVNEVNNRYGIEHGWSWLARILNLEPISITVELLEAFLSIAGFTLYRTYGRQYTKLLVYIRDEFISRVPKDTPQDALFRIRDLVKTTLEKGLQQPPGKALKNEAEPDDED